MTTQIAFLFPGQGSQAVGMGADVYAASEAARHVFDTVDKALGLSLSAVCFHGPEETLRETINAQPAIVTVSLAFLAALQEALSPGSSSWSAPLVPTFTAGHSVGEYAALVASGALALPEAARLVRERGRLMHHEGTVCPGGMAAVIGMEVDVLQQVCQQATERALDELQGEPGVARHPGQGRVAIANYNAPGQIVISGEQRALTLAIELARARGAKRVIPLAVSGAFHSAVMRPASEGLARAIADTDVRAVRIPVVGNIDAMPLSSPDQLRAELAQQIAASVQWTRTIEYLASAGVNTFFEIGPGQALSGMVKRIVKGATTIPVGSVAEVEKAAVLARETGLVRDV